MLALFDIFFLCCLSVLSPWGVYIFTVPLHVALWAFSLDAANPEARSWKISVELLLKCFSLWLNPVNFVKSTTWLQVGHQTSQVVQRVWPSIVTQVSIGGGFTYYPAVLLELLYPLLMAALSYPLPHPPKMCICKEQNGCIVTCMCTKLYTKITVLFCSLNTQILDLCKWQESFYYNIKCVGYGYNVLKKKFKIKPICECTVTFPCHL